MVFEHSIWKLFKCLQPSTCDRCTTQELLCRVQMVVSSQRCFACVECHQAKVRCSLLADLLRSKWTIFRGRMKASEALVRSKNGEDEGQSTGSPSTEHSRSSSRPTKSRSTTCGRTTPAENRVLRKESGSRQSESCSLIPNRKFTTALCQ